MIRPKLLIVGGATVSAFSLVAPRLPLIPTGIGSGRASLVVTAAVCGSPLGRLGAALSATVTRQCGQIALLSGIGWLLLVAGIGAVVTGAVMRWRGWPK